MASYLDKGAPSALRCNRKVWLQALSDQAQLLSPGWGNQVKEFLKLGNRFQKNLVRSDMAAPRLLCS